MYTYNRKKAFALLLLVGFVCTPFGKEAFTQASDPSLNTYESFVANIGNDIIKILVNKSVPLPQRKAEFRKVLRENFSIPAIGKFVLASYWRRATPEQKKEYLQLFEDAIVENYAAQFDSYDNERLDVRGARKTKDGGVIVKSMILRPTGGEPLNLDWKIFQTKKGMKVLDLVVNGVSMSITQRTEYRAIVRSKGGKIEGLLLAMRERR